MNQDDDGSSPQSARAGTLGSRPGRFEQFRLAAELSSDLVFETNPDGIIDWVSRSVTRVLGWEPDEVLGVPSTDLVHPEDMPGLLASPVRSDPGEVRGERRTRLLTSTGSYRWMSAQTHPVTDTTGAVEAVLVRARDVHEETLVDKALRTVAEGSAVLVRAAAEGGLLQRVCDTVVESGSYQLAWYGRPVSDAAKSVAVVARSGDLSCDLDRVAMTWDETPAVKEPTGEAIRTRRIQGSRDLKHDPLARPWWAAATTCRLGSSLALPVLVDGFVDGVLNVYGAEVGDFNRGAQALLADLATDIGYGLARLRDRAKLFGAMVNSVDLLAATVESRDPYTAGHELNVSVLAVRLGQELGLDEDQLLGLELGAKIHDLGRIAIPPEILNKRAPLSPAERLEVARHAEVGWEIASKFEWPWPIAEIIHQHHERLDGSGYPQGLRGEQIMWEARIVAVADVYDALSHGRPQRSPHGKERSLEILMADKGSRFDSEVIEALVRVLDTESSPPVERNP